MQSMRKIYWFICLSVSFSVNAQVDVKLNDAMQVFVRDSQMRHAIVGLTVLDAKTGRMVYGYNEQIGLAPASTQKIFTSAAAFELLGKDYKYQTQLAYDGSISKGVLNGNLYIIGSGDPTFGSWRYSSTKDSVVLKKWVDAVAMKNIKRIGGGLVMMEQSSSFQSIPDGWIWQDIGNYYGAGSHGLNWRENQYDVVLKSGDNVGDEVTIVSPKTDFVNQLKTAAKGTGDNAFIYLPEGLGGRMLLAGTIPAGEKAFTISGATTNPAGKLRDDILLAFSIMGITTRKEMPRSTLAYLNTHYSPPLDSINYWFMRRSINLYGEALMKTMGSGVTDTGVRIVRDFWANKGIDKAAVNIIDGSGLSPQNRVTADALAHVLYFAQSRPWFASFYESLPTYNGMKLKSGSIGGARAFAGYHTSAQGTAYIVAIIVNNYARSSGEIVKKMYRVLDMLK
jgi:serine-type D-Ala-D-Ala carboxypeptidase/endopeptidase (penicillin-binding protein 4)